MKVYVKWALLIIAFAVFSLLVLYYFTQGNAKKISQSQIVSKTSLGLPVRLKISAINVNAGIQYVGVTSNGAMEVPNNTVDVGWFNLGPRPGETGSAVIAGHFDGQNGEAGVFTNLNKLKKGDKLYVDYGNRKSIIFVVRESRIYNPGYADDVFSSSDGIHLNLVTCDGVWDGTKKSYSKRLVIFADIAH